MRTRHQGINTPFKDNELFTELRKPEQWEVWVCEGNVQPKELARDLNWENKETRWILVVQKVEHDSHIVTIVPLTSQRRHSRWDVELKVQRDAVDSDCWAQIPLLYSIHKSRLIEKKGEISFGTQVNCLKAFSDMLGLEELYRSSNKSKNEEASP